jgi:agmatine/peptidylarginine deiminase
MTYQEGNRFMAEWESDGAILVSVPNSATDWDYMLEEAEEQYRRLIDTFAKAGERVLVVCSDIDDARRKYGDVASAECRFHELPYNDTWTRDYGPLTVLTADNQYLALDFCFNGWGLKFAANLDNALTSALTNTGMIKQDCYRNCRDYVLEGGSVETDGNGTLLTTSTCLCSDNRNELPRHEVEKVLKARLGVKHILWLDHGALAGDDTDSHVDTLARIAPHDTIIYVGCPDADDEHYAEMRAMEEEIRGLRTAEGQPFSMVALPFAAPQYDEEGTRLPATYANYLVTKRNLFVPTYGDPQRDKLAMQIIHSVFPDKELYGIDCRALICQHGSLHCATMQLPRQILAF